MLPDDINGCPLEAALKLLPTIPQPNPLKEATPVSWATTNHDGGNEL